jgi:hypothetical protein
MGMDDVRSGLDNPLANEPRRAKVPVMAHREWIGLEAGKLCAPK